MYNILKTGRFEKWFNSIKDTYTKAKIDVKIRRMELGNLGDVKLVGDGISETRIHCGSGLRIYFYLQGNVVIILLCGGDKSTQQKDIEIAKELKKCLK